VKTTSEIEASGEAADPTTEIKKATKKPQVLEYLHNGRFNAAYLKQAITKGDQVSEADVPPDAFKRLKGSGFFKVVATLVLAMAMLASSPATAQTSGTNFTYPSKIGWAGSKVDQLPTIFAAQDTLFTGVRAGVHSPVADVTALKAIAATGATARTDKQLCYVESLHAVAAFDAQSSTAGNDTTVFAPASGTGRWFLLDGTASGANVSIADAGEYFTGTTAETVLQEVGLGYARRAGTPTAGHVCTLDADGDPTDSGTASTDMALYSVLIAVANGMGASLVGVEDVATKIAATTVEGALAEIAADGWVTASRLASDAVTGVKILNGEISAAKLAGSSVSNIKLASDAVTTDKILDATILFGDLALNSCIAGQVPVVNAGATAWECGAGGGTALAGAERVHTGAQTLADNTETPVIYATSVTTSAAIAYDAVTYDYTVTDAGTYTIAAGVTFAPNATGSTRQVDIQYEVAADTWITLARGTGAASGEFPATVTVATSVRLPATGAVRVTAKHDGGAPVDITTAWPDGITIQRIK